VVSIGSDAEDDPNAPSMIAIHVFIARFLNFSTFCSLTYSQIWLSPIVDDLPTHLHHKFKKKKNQKRVKKHWKKYRYIKCLR
jgi:hypothetical protein